MRPQYDVLPTISAGATWASSPLRGLDGLHLLVILAVARLRWVHIRLTKPVIPLVADSGKRLFGTPETNPAVYAPEIDSAVLVGFPAAEKYLHFDGHPSQIYVRTVDTQAAVTAVDNLLGAQANPENPGQVTVSQPSAAPLADARLEPATNCEFMVAVALREASTGLAQVSTHLMHWYPELGCYARTPLRNARQISCETISFGPTGALESRTATRPGRLRATSTQLPLWLL